MRLDELLEGIDTLDLREIYPDMQVDSVTCDSRQVSPGSAFVAIVGDQADGHQYIPDALAAGATLVVHSKPVPPEMVGSFVRVPDSREAYALLSVRLAGQPSRQMRVIGVTGTNGKTSTVLLAAHLLNRGGLRAAALGTLGLLRPDTAQFERRGLTTPDAADLQRLLRELVDDGVTHLLMEVSSHALAQHRVTGVEFTGAVFTNLTQDHYDYHETREAYIEAKASLFTHHLVLSGGYAVINTDDEVGLEIARRFGGIGLRFGQGADNNLVMSGMSNSLAGIGWELLLKNGIWPQRRDPSVNHARFKCPLVGRYNIYNCVAAAGVALLEGLALPQVVEGLSGFDSVPGRLQSIPNQRGVHVFVDYAHTPDAVASVLSALQELRLQDSRMITVLGCGGDRDQGKRPLMGRAAQTGSDLTVITSDNPRSEAPETIIDQILAGTDKQGTEVRTECDRRNAIRLALQAARPGDIVLIAGKGHEDYQILGNSTIHFSDAEEAAILLANGD
jgi:UDP-N-acetylmuramoyl-L-alanyl-D-glutamate--2,6-diaminopimelate ligase